MQMDQRVHNKAEVCFCQMARLIHKGKDRHQKIMADFEKSITRTILAEYKSNAERAVKAALGGFKGRDTEAQANQIIKLVDREMNKFGSDSLLETLSQEIELLYEETATDFVKAFDLNIKKATRRAGTATIDFTLQDKQAIESIQRISVQTAGRYYPEQIADKTSQVIRSVILERGLPIKEAAKVLEAEIRGALGVKEADSVIPTQFKNNPQAYFEIVSSNASVTSTSLSRMISMSDAGIEKYRITAILDTHTSTICRSLDGKEFSVEKTMGAVEKFFGVESLDQLESSFGFTKDGSVPKWAAQGLGFPPYHHRCRTTVVPVF